MAARAGPVDPETVPPFTPVGRAPLSLLVSEQLRESIVSGTVAVGAALPTEKELTEQFQVSRSTIREALRILQAEGLVSGGDSVSTARPRVSSARTVGSAARALENVLRLGQVPLPDLLDLRLLIEGAALAEAAVDPQPDALADARDALDQMRAPDVGIEAFHAADVAFHIALVGAAGNRAYHLVLGVLRDAVATHLLASLAGIADPGPVQQQLVAEHTAILTAVERGDGEAAREQVIAHVRGFYETQAQGERAT